MQSALDPHPYYVRLRIPLLIGALLSVALYVSGQSSFVLIIDTVQTPSDGFNVIIQPRSGCPQVSPSLIDSSDHVTTYYLEWNVAPNLVLHFPMDTCVGAIELDLDDDGGRLEIKWPGELPPDSIHIPRFQVLERCQRDTITRTTAYFNMKDTLAAPEEVRTSQFPGSKPPIRKCREQTGIVVNGKKYIVPLRSVRSDETVVVNFHGFDPFGCNEQVPESRRRGKPCRYFHGTEKWQMWCYFGTVLVE